MADVTIRIYLQHGDGQLEDAVQDFGLEAFGGCLPQAGDAILEPGVLQGLDRSNPQNRVFWHVIRRIFNPRDNADYVALIVEERPLTQHEEVFVL